MNIHGGYWRAKYDLKHAGHLCAALTAKGLATWNVEYRRVGNPGGGWPGTFEDLRSAYRYVSQIAQRYKLDLSKLVVMGHSAGGQLALCLAGHEPAIKRVVSLAGVVDLQQAWELHLSDNAVVDFLGANPAVFPSTIAKPIPCKLKIPSATQWLIHGAADDTVPPFFSRNYTEQKKTARRKRALPGNLHRRPLRPDRSPLQRLAQSGRYDSASAAVVKASSVVGPWSLAFGRWHQSTALRMLADDRRPTTNDCFTHIFSTPAPNSSIRNAMQLHTACSIAFLRPTSGT